MSTHHITMNGIEIIVESTGGRTSIRTVNSQNQPQQIEVPSQPCIDVVPATPSPEPMQEVPASPQPCSCQRQCPRPCPASESVGFQMYAPRHCPYPFGSDTHPYIESRIRSRMAVIDTAIKLAPWIVGIAAVAVLVALGAVFLGW